MSFLVEHLILETTRLKETHDLESDDYNDLLLIEKKIKELKSKQLLTDNEVLVLDYFSQGYLYKDMEEIMGIGRVTIIKIFKEVCQKIAYFLGGSFTDEGEVEEMAIKYNLNDEQIEKLEKFISSRYRHRLSRTNKEQ
jgi:hypothetical protein